MVRQNSYPELVKKLNVQGLKNNLRCAHINANGLFNKLDEVKILLKEAKFDLLTITESHLTNDLHNDNEISIEGYSFLRNDRSGKKNHWGGVIVYYRNSLELHQINVETEVESIWLELMIKSQKLLVGNIYRPPNDKNFLQQINLILNKISHRNNILLIGDFNIDMFDNNKALTKDFKQTLDRHNLVNVIRTHTRITESSKTLIDLAITADNSKILRSGTHGVGISDHDLIFVVMNLFTRKTPPRLISVRSYKNIDTIKIKQELETVPWHIIGLFDDPDDSLWCWQHLLRSVISQHVKIRKVKVKGNNQMWMTGEVRKLINKRYKLLLKARATPKDSQEWKDYRMARNTCTNLIRITKANYWKNKFIASDSPKTFWSLVKKYNNSNTKPNHIGPLKNKTTFVTNDLDKANVMNEFFSSIGKKIATPIEPDVNMNSYIYRITPSICNVHMSNELLTKSFKAAVREGKACGPDNITAKDLKLHPECAIRGLQEVVQCSLASGKFPSDWKISKVTAVYKKGCKSDCSNYRPISLLSIPSKIVEHLICTQLTDHLIKNNLLNEHQWGFRPRRSTEDILLHMTEKWRKALDNGQVVGVLFIDFRKAFDSVSHPILIQKLKACGISGDFHSYLESYLTNRRQYTNLNGSTSNLTEVEFGVPQGSLIGPPSFSVNINDINDAIDSELDLFADDSTAHTIGDTVDIVMSDLQKSAKQLDIYAKRNSLEIHPDKCEILIISKKSFIGPHMNVEIMNKSVKIVNSSRCLGVTIDNELKWDTHIQNTCKSFSNKVKKLFQMRQMPKSTLSSIYFQGILPSVLYGIVVWGNCSPALMNNIEKIHIRAARFIHRLKRTVPDTSVISLVKWLPIVNYYKRNLACKTYKIYNELASPLLSNLVLKNKSRRGTRNLYKLNLPSFKYVDFKRSFIYRAAIVWNNLPNHIREKESFSCFKSSLKKSDILEKINFNITGRALKSVDYVY